MTKRLRKRKSLQTTVADESDSEGEASGTSENRHLTDLRGTECFETKYHITPPPAKKVKVSNDQERFCWWVNSDVKQTVITESDIEEFVEREMTPDGTVIKLKIKGHHISANFISFCVIRFRLISTTFASRIRKLEKNIFLLKAIC